MSREALVVGINYYFFLEKPPLPAKDAEAVARMLETHGGFRVRRLPVQYNADGRKHVALSHGDRPLDGQNPCLTMDQLKEAIEGLFNPSSNRPGETIDTAILYFTGHGLVDEKGEVYLASSEAKVGDRYGLSCRWLRSLLLSSPVRQKLVWLDCCHSGELLNFNDAYSDIQGSLCLIAACRSFEAAYQYSGAEHGVLTGVLLEALDPNNPHHQKGWVTNRDLVDYINKKLATTTQAPVTYNFKSEIVITGPEDIIDRAKLLEKYCPYKGLESFEFDDSEYFYGRTTLVEEMLERLSESNFLAVLGASGSGKSSVVKAGLLRKWQERMGSRGSDACKIVIFRPGEDPLQSLVRAFGRAPDKYKLSSVDDLVQLRRDTNAPELVLVADQFEEIFTRCQDIPLRELFLSCLLGALDAPGERIRAIVTMRADFLGLCVQRDYSGLNRKIQDNLILVTPMNQKELREAIERPAWKVQLEVPDGLVKQMLWEAKEPGSLPLLQYTLRELWYNRDAERLTSEKYNELGGVKGTLSKQAEKVYQSLNDRQQSAAKWIFQNLTQVNESSEDTRKQALKSALSNDRYPSEVIDTTLHQLVEARLLVTDKPEGGETTIDVAHEALIRHWERLRGWVESARDALLFKRKIESEAKDWLKNNKSDDFLRLGARWDELWSYLREQDDLFGLLSPLEQEFINNSRRQRILPDVNQIQDLLNYEPVKALTWAIKTTGLYLPLNKSKGSPPPPELQSSLRDAIVKSLERNKFVGHEDYVLSVAFSPNGKLIVSGSSDKTLRLWDLEGNPIGSPFYGHENSVSSVAVSPDGKQIVSGSLDKTLRLWDLEGNPIGSPFQGHKKAVKSVAFSPDGKQIVSGSLDNKLRLWDLGGNPIGSPFQGHENSVLSVAFSPDGKQIVSGSVDKTLRLWDLEGNPIGSPFQGHENSVLSVAFSPDGKQIVSGSSDNKLRLWDLEGNPIGSAFQGHKNSVLSVAFSPDGKQIVSGSNDKTLRLWDLEGNPIVSPFSGHKNSVSSVEFSPDGKQIVSSSNDKTLRLWYLEGNPIGSPFQGHENSVLSVAFSPDGKKIVSGSIDKSLRLWDLKGNPIGSPFQGHKNQVLSVAFSPDGKQIVSGSSDKTLRLWDLEGNPIGSPFQGHKNYVRSVAFSPDGKQIVSGSDDKTLRLWDLEGNPIGSPFQGHKNYVRSVAFSPDGKQIVSSSIDKTLRLWDLEGNPIGSPFQGHENEVGSVAFSPDGKQIVSGSIDKTLRLWSLEGNPIGSPFQRHENSVRSVAFSPDGKYIVSGSSDNTLRLWQGSKWEHCLAVACNLLQFHPVLAGPDASNDAQWAVETCRMYVWDEIEYARFLVRQGWLLVLQERDVEGAIAKFREAHKLDRTVDWNAMASEALKLLSDRKKG